MPSNLRYGFIRKRIAAFLFQSHQQGTNFLPVVLPTEPLCTVVQIVHCITLGGAVYIATWAKGAKWFLPAGTCGADHNPPSTTGQGTICVAIC